MFVCDLFADSVNAQPALEKMLGGAVIPEEAALPSATKLDIMQELRPALLSAMLSLLLHFTEVAPPLV